MHPQTDIYKSDFEAERMDRERMACELDELRERLEVEQRERERLARELQQHCGSPELLLGEMCAEQGTGGEEGRRSRTSRGRTKRAQLRFLLFSNLKAGLSPKSSPKKHSSVKKESGEEEPECCRAENEVHYFQDVYCLYRHKNIHCYVVQVWSYNMAHQIASPSLISDKVSNNYIQYFLWKIHIYVPMKNLLISTDCMLSGMHRSSSLHK